MRSDEDYALSAADPVLRDDEWLDGACYLNMKALREQGKVQLPLAA